MKWIEIIKIRLAESSRGSLEPQLAELISKVDHNGGLSDIKLFQNAVVNGDLSIHLQWESEKVDAQGSATGLCLIHILKEFGLISHSIWVEEEGKGYPEIAEQGEVSSKGGPRKSLF